MGRKMENYYLLQRRRAACIKPLNRFQFQIGGFASNLLFILQNHKCQQDFNYLALLSPVIASSLLILSTQGTSQETFVIWAFLASKYFLYTSHLTD